MSKIFKILLGGILLYILYNTFIKKKVGENPVSNIINDLKDQIHKLENKFDKTISEENHLDSLYSQLLKLTKK